METKQPNIDDFAKIMENLTKTDMDLKANLGKFEDMAKKMKEQLNESIVDESKNVNIEGVDCVCSRKGDKVTINFVDDMQAKNFYNIIK